MTTFCTEAWLRAYRIAWNEEPGLRQALARIGFTARIGYGLINEQEPRGVLTVVEGIVTAAGPPDGAPLDWDLRARLPVWEQWLTHPPGLIALGAAYTVGELKFMAGDYAGMIKDPRLAGPFVKSFQVMARIAAGLEPTRKGGCDEEKRA
jgi:hypothetical protein